MFSIPSSHLWRKWKYFFLTKNSHNLANSIINFLFHFRRKYGIFLLQASTKFGDIFLMFISHFVRLFIFFSCLLFFARDSIGLVGQGVNVPTPTFYSLTLMIFFSSNSLCLHCNRKQPGVSVEEFWIGGVKEGVKWTNPNILFSHVDHTIFLSNPIVFKLLIWDNYDSWCG